jgi:cytosine/adenosine deaminase-related metal-dependent hydrolase
MRATWLTDALCLIEQPGAGWQAARRSIEIRDGRIAALHDTPPPPAAGELVLAAEGMLCTPGLINAHHHSPDNLIRGSAPDLPLELWSLHSAAGREQRSPREVYLAALLGCVEMLRGGVTTVLDHIRFSPAMAPETLDAVAQAYRDAGMRAVIAPVLADRAVADTLPLEAADLDGADISAYGRRPAMPATEQLALVAGFVADWHGHDGRLGVAIGPSAPQRCSDALLLAAAGLAARHGLVLHMHLLETLAQRAMGLRRHAGGMVAHLDTLGLLGPRTGLAHALWLEDGDPDLLARRGAAVVHNPVSNARLGSGRFGLRRLRDAGLRIALGTDSACCNDSNSMLETIKAATLLTRQPTVPPEAWATPAEILSLATSGAADVLGLGALTGRIAAGMAADLALFRLASPAFAPLLDPVRQLVLAENGAALDSVLVAGRVVLRHGRCTRLDEAALWAEAQGLAARRLRDNAGVLADASALEAPLRRMHRRLHGHCCT